MSSNCGSLARSFRRTGLGLLFLATVVQAQPMAPPPFADEVEFGEWVTYYYTNPQPARLVEALEYYVGSSLFANENGRIPLAQFAAEILRGEDELTRALYERAAGGVEPLRAFTLHVLWLIDSGASRGLLADAAVSWEGAAAVVSQMRAEPPLDLFSVPVASAADLDRLWGIFLATGERRPVERVASALAWEGAAQEKLLIHGAARWSLLSNSLQHDRVLGYVVELARSSEGTERAGLEEVLAEIRGQ